ncbi:MAG TPA: response regulator transcription factor [Steroidobacteraceae bacterium]|nr:response regulator transcription factor [Steroidobacteraceae bacterium]
MSTDCPKQVALSSEGLSFHEEGLGQYERAYEPGNGMQSVTARAARARSHPKSSTASGAPVWPQWASRKARPSYAVVLVDDHAVVREGIAALLALESGLEVVGCAGDVASAIELVRAAQPAVVVCDLNLPGVSGGQAVQAIREEVPKAAILVLTVHNSLEYVRAAFISGAVGFVCKDAPARELARAVRRAASGQRTVCGSVREAVIGDWLEHCPPAEPAFDADLDEQARQMLRYIALGVPTWRIARDLGYGVKEAERYRGKLMRRLALKSSAAVTRFAVGHRLVNSLELDHVLEVQGA